MTPVTGVEAFRIGRGFVLEVLETAAASILDARQTAQPDERAVRCGGMRLTDHVLIIDE